MAENATTTFFPSSHSHVEFRQLPFELFLIARKDLPDNLSFGLRKNLNKFSAVEETYGSILDDPATKVLAFHLPSKLRQLLILMLA